ncbi:MAG TPA: outer membrane beta-barrel protein [Candidatus Saccharimonadales bacterium]|nr:outer membrane beta-barrel protein [Candidatus Saccharimonadales bacterium]
MKRVLAVTALLLMVASVAMAAETATKKGDLDIWVGAGYSTILSPNIPSGAPSIKGSLGALVGVYYMVMPAVGVGVMSGYLIAEKQTIADVSGSDSLKFTGSIIPITAQGIYVIPAKGVKPYVGVGLGIYMIHSKAEDVAAGVSASDNTSKFGFNVGAGFSVPAGEKMSVGVDAKLHLVKDTDVADDGTPKMGKFLTAVAAVHFK